jgi:hypothetical protein
MPPALTVTVFHNKNLTLWQLEPSLAHNADFLPMLNLHIDKIQFISVLHCTICYWSVIIYIFRCPFPSEYRFSTLHVHKHPSAFSSSFEFLLANQLQYREFRTSGMDAASVGNGIPTFRDSVGSLHYGVEMSEKYAGGRACPAFGHFRHSWGISTLGR